MRLAAVGRAQTGEIIVTRRRTNTLALLVIVGLLFVGAGCSSGGDDTTVDGGAEVELPEGWPTEIGVPKGIEIGLRQSEMRGGEPVLGFTGDIAKADEAEIYDWIVGNLQEAGYTLDNQGDGYAPGMASRFITGVRDDRTVVVTVLQQGKGVHVSYKLEPAR